MKKDVEYTHTHTHRTLSKNSKKKIAQSTPWGKMAKRAADCGEVLPASVSEKGFIVRTIKNSYNFIR